MKVKIRETGYYGAPEYQTDGSSGMDIQSIDDAIIDGHSRVLVHTGLHVGVPRGYELQIRSRSGMAAKHGIIVLNQPGTIDSDYRDEIGVILYNTTDEAYEIRAGDRIAQMVLCPVTRCEWVETGLNATKRKGGFGSTGR